MGSEFLKDERNPDRLAVFERFERKLRMHGSLAPAALRAAGGVIRGVFSASNILALDRESVRARGAAGAVATQQKARIMRLLHTALDLQAARDCRDGTTRDPDLKKLWEDALKERLAAPGEGADDLFEDKDIPALLAAAAAADPSGAGPIRSLAAELAGLAAAPSHPYLDRRPFYAEEIAWLYNERAMLSLAQGDLYNAATAISLALGANAHIEGDLFHPKRCRLLLNQAFLQIERGQINHTRRCLDDLRQALRRKDMDLVHPGTKEGRLILAIARGYEALCDDLQGLIGPAERGYEEAIGSLEELRQQRGVAIFELHRAALQHQLPGREDLAARAFARAIAAAEFGRHTDIVYRIRIARAEADRLRGTLGPADALAVHQAAREYGEQFEMHRVTVQALGASTQLRLAVGEVEAAAHDCSRALALATRYGMALPRITLRILMGRVLERRGDTENARFLFERAVIAAEAIGYQRAIDRGRAQLMRLKDPPQQR